MPAVADARLPALREARRGRAELAARDRPDASVTSQGSQSRRGAPADATPQPPSPAHADGSGADESNSDYVPSHDGDDEDSEDDDFAAEDEDDRDDHDDDEDDDGVVPLLQRDDESEGNAHEDNDDAFDGGDAAWMHFPPTDPFAFVSDEDDDDDDDDDDDGWVRSRSQHLSAVDALLVCQGLRKVFGDLVQPETVVALARHVFRQSFALTTPVDRQELRPYTRAFAGRLRQLMPLWNQACADALAAVDAEDAVLRAPPRPVCADPAGTSASSSGPGAANAAPGAAVEPALATPTRKRRREAAATPARPRRPHRGVVSASSPRVVAAAGAAAATAHPRLGLVCDDLFDALAYEPAPPATLFVTHAPRSPRTAGSGRMGVPLSSFFKCTFSMGGGFRSVDNAEFRVGHLRVLARGPLTLQDLQRFRQEIQGALLTVPRTQKDIFALEVAFAAHQVTPMELIADAVIEGMS